MKNQPLRRVRLDPSTPTGESFRVACEAITEAHAILDGVPAAEGDASFLYREHGVAAWHRPAGLVANGLELRASLEVVRYRLLNKELEVLLEALDERFRTHLEVLFIGAEGTEDPPRDLVLEDVVDEFAHRQTLQDLGFEGVDRGCAPGSCQYAGQFSGGCARPLWVEACLYPDVDDDVQVEVCTPHTCQWAGMDGVCHAPSDCSGPSSSDEGQAEGQLPRW